MQRQKPITTYCVKKVLTQDIDLGSRYDVLEKIGQGSFGDIYKVYDKLKNQLGAVKLERKEKKGPQGMLSKEAKILSDLNKFDGFPRLIEMSIKDNYNFLVMSYLGPNLENLKKKRGGSLSLKTVLLAGIQMINDLQMLHKEKYVHRDIKPENFVIGTDGNHHTVYLIDFGLSKKYVDEKGDHINFVENKGLVGTARYTSINSHLGSEQSRRDDLESLGYVLLYFVKGFLPWQNFQADTRQEKFRKILETKVSTHVDELCHGLPGEFRKFFKHIKGLGFDEIPDYDLLKGLFKTCIQNLYKNTKMCYDWCPLNCKLDVQFNNNQQQMIQTKSLAVLPKKNSYQDLMALDIEERKDSDAEIKIPKLEIDENKDLSKKKINYHNYNQDKTLKCDKQMSSNHFQKQQQQCITQCSIDKEKEDNKTNGKMITEFNSKSVINLGCGQNNGSLNNYANLNPLAQSQMQLQAESDGNKNHKRFKSELDLNAPSAIQQTLHDDSSKYLNISNEWNEMQEENVEINQVISSSPVKLQTRKINTYHQMHQSCNQSQQQQQSSQFQNQFKPNSEKK